MQTLARFIVFPDNSISILLRRRYISEATARRPPSCRTRFAIRLRQLWGLVDLSPPIPALPGKPLYPCWINVTQILQDVPFPDRGRKISDFWFLRIDKTAISRYDTTRRRGRGAMRQRLGSIAQLGEHLPYKQRVTGSSPVVPTKLWPGSSVG